MCTSLRRPLLILRDNAELNALICNWRVQCWLTGCPETHRKPVKQWNLLFKNQRFQFLLHCHYLEFFRGNTILFVLWRKCRLFVLSLSSAVLSWHGLGAVWEDGHKGQFKDSEDDLVERKLEWTISVWICGCKDAERMQTEWSLLIQNVIKDRLAKSPNDHCFWHLSNLVQCFV